MAVDTGAGNEGLDYPELVFAGFRADGLHVNGRIDPSLNIDRLELYISSNGAGDSWGGADYGEGNIYLGTLPVAALTLDLATGDFSGVLTTPPPGGWAAVSTGQPVTAIAIDVGNNTSEFGNNVDPNAAPTAVDSAVNFVEDSNYLFKTTDFGFSGGSLASIRIRYASLQRDFISKRHGNWFSGRDRHGDRTGQRRFVI